MNELRSKLGGILKRSGYSVTRPRWEVFQFLSGKEPVSVSSITKALEKSIDRASVYRTVNLFQELGIVQRHNVGWKYKIELSDAFSEHHHHLTCIRCGKITMVHEKSLELSMKNTARWYGYQMTGHQVELQGYCEDCEKKP